MSPRSVEEILASLDAARAARASESLNPANIPSLDARIANLERELGGSPEEPAPADGTAPPSTEVPDRPTEAPQPAPWFSRRKDVCSKTKPTNRCKISQYRLERQKEARKSALGPGPQIASPRGNSKPISDV